MEKQSLTFKLILIGSLWSLLEFVENRIGLQHSSYLPDQLVLEKLNVRNENNQNRYGTVMRGDMGESRVVKSLIYKHKDLSYRHMNSEINVIQAMNHLIHETKKELSFRLPKLYSVSDKNNELKINLEYVDGKSFKTFSNSYKLEVLNKILADFKLVSKKLDKETLDVLPKRGIKEIIFSYPFFVLGAIIKEPALFLQYLNLSYKFYKLLEDAFQGSYVISHRDLHSENILVKDGKANVLDFEMAVMAHEFTDLSIIARLYLSELGIKDVVRLINQNIKDKQDKKKFLFYTIFYTIQTLALESKKTPNYKNALNYCRCLMSDLVQGLNEEKSQNVSRRLKSVTVGIPALNEAKNIGNLLNSLLVQNLNGISVEEIVVVSDGSTDETVSTVRGFSKKHRFIKVVDGKSRKGKALRLNEIFKRNKSDILLAIDGDTLLDDKDALRKLVGYFDDDGVALVSCNKQPTKAQNFVEAIINAQFVYWYEVRKSINRGDNVYNTSSCAVALRGKFAKKINFPKGTILTSPYLYFSALVDGMRFRFAEDVKVLYRSPDNFKDYIKQISRTSNDMEVNENVFGTSVHFYERVPLLTKIKSLIKTMLKAPLYTPEVVLLNLFIGFYKSKNDKLGEKGLWETVTSSKKSINLAQ